MGKERKELSRKRRAGAAAGIAIFGAGVLLILLCFALLIFGGKAEGRLAGKKSLSRGKYRFTYVYTVDGQDYEFMTVRKVPHSADDEDFKTRKISYLPAAPSFACTDGKFGVGMLMGIIGIYVWAFSKYGVNNINKSRRRRAEKSRAMWKGHIEKKTGSRKKE